MNTSNVRMAVRDSGIRGLGEIPAHWRVMALKHLVSMPITDGPHETPEFVDSGVPFLSAEAVWSGRVHIEDMRGFISRDAHDLYSKKYRPAKNDIFVVKSGATTGKVAIVDIEDEFGVWSPLAAIRCDHEEALPQFVFYSLVSDYFQGQVQISWSLGTQPNIGMEVLENLYVFLPPLPAQRAIADYLDRETARLDALVAAKERVLELLAEKRRALITLAVTRGLDPHASLRDSGIPWLGAIPAHWEVWKLGHLALVGNGSTPNREKPEYWIEGSIPWLNSSVVNQEEVTASDQFVTDTALRECHLPLVSPGSVLIGITGQGRTRGQAVVLSFEATINQHLAFIMPGADRLDTWFLRWALFAAYEFLRSISDDAGGTKGALTCEEVAALRLPVPPMAQQRAIVGHVATEAAKLDRMRLATERTIALLKERRSALIAAAVTGQIDVPAVPPENQGMVVPKTTARSGS